MGGFGHHSNLTVITLLTVISLASTELYHIVPNHSLNLCENYAHGRCTSLVAFAKWFSDKNKESTLTVAFSPGEYCLTQYISITGISNVTLIGDESQPPLIKFEGCSGFILSNISTLSILNLNMSRFGQTVLNISTVENIRLEGCQMFGKGSNKQQQQQQQQQQNSTVYIKIAKAVLICRIHFENNHIRILEENNTLHIRGGALSIVDVQDISIIGSSFVNNQVRGLNFVDGGGAIYVKNIDKMAMLNCTMTNNNAVCSECQDVTGGAFSSNLLIELTITNSTFERNRALSSLKFDTSTSYGGAIYAKASMITVSGCQFVGNIAANGGAIHVSTEVQNVKYGVLSTIDGGVNNITGKSASSLEKENDANENGAGTYFISVTTYNNSFTDNTATETGGAINLAITKNGFYNNSRNLFINNTATIYDGGAVAVYMPVTKNISYHSSYNHFTNNSASRNGGATRVYGFGNYLSLKDTYINNTAQTGGGMSVSIINTYLKMVYFRSNHASKQGAAIHCLAGRLQVFGCVILGNHADDNGVMYINSGSFLGRNTRFSSNNGSLFTVSSRVELCDNFTFSNNIGNMGGAITGIQSTISLNKGAIVTITQNQATQGGGIFLSESQLNIFCTVYITGNIAMNTGGGLYVYQGEILFGNPDKRFITSTFWIHTGNFVAIIRDNVARGGGHGGGTCLIASNVKIYPGIFKFSNNTGVLGGAVYLEQSSKIYVLNELSLVVWTTFSDILEFTKNRADYGGAVYISDNTAAGTLCERDNNQHTLVRTECFMQSLSLFKNGISRQYLDSLYTRTTIFTNNTAISKGNDVYGGLLDRCTINIFSDPHALNYTGLDYVKAMTTFNCKRGIDLRRGDLKDHITSDAVQLCYCMDDNLYDCTVMEHHVSVKRGEAFTVKMTAVDQIQNQVDSTVIATFNSNSSIGHFKEEQMKRDIRNTCTELTYNVYSEKSQIQIDLYADGPCGDKGISRRTLNVNFRPCDCPIGFQPSKSPTECICNCAQELEGNIANCSIENETIQLSTNIWIGYVNESQNNTGFIIYPTCPYNFCLEKPINITLNIPNGADMQCAFNRTNLLCGECEKGYSLVLGSSRCKLCTNNYLSLLLLFVLLGVLLVAFILILNLTVATGTIHGLIFYANIVGATQSTFFSRQDTILTVSISWLNLDFGIEICFYDGMNSYAKVLLQLVFPSYLIFLTMMIIILCEHSQRFTALLGSKNPVATLSTLILLSYSKLLRMIITALQYTYLDYPDGSRKTVWLYDASVPYFQPSHIPRFIIAAIIVVLGAVYTILLFFGQWLPRLSKWKFMRWTRHPKYNAFIDAYHAPFSPKQRYWMGLLLFARIVHNLVEALRTEAAVSLLSVACIALALVLLRTINMRTYKNWTLDALENSFLVNLSVLSVGTFYVRDSKGNQAALIIISTSIAFMTFLVILCYHVYKYILKNTRLWRALTQAVRRRPYLNRGYQLVPVVEDEPDSDDDNSVEGYVTDPYSNYTGDESTIEEPHFHDSPIIRSALNFDQLREPALDILDPVTADHYREARRRPPAPVPRPVTYTVIDKPSH